MVCAQLLADPSLLRLPAVGICQTRKIPLPQWPLPWLYITVGLYVDFLSEVSSRLVALTNEACPWPECGTWLAKLWPLPQPPAGPRRYPGTWACGRQNGDPDGYEATVVVF